MKNIKDNIIDKNSKFEYNKTVKLNISGSRQAKSAIRLYKIISHDTSQMQSANLINLTRICLDFIQKCTNEKLDMIYKNYERKHLSVDKFYDYINEMKPVEYFCAHNSKNPNQLNETCIHYGNGMLALTDENKKEETHIGLLILLKNYFIDKDEIIKFINAIYNIIDIDYGNIFYSEHDQYVDIISEGKWQKRLFSYSIKNMDYIKLDILNNVKNGSVPKIYKYNILNNNQIKSLNINNSIKINENLHLYEE